MPSKTVFLGDVSDYLSHQAKRYHADAWLMTEHNCQQFVTAGTDITVYTSLGDLSKDLNTVFDVLNLASTVIYCPPDTWSDQQTVDCSDPCSSMQGLTETVLLMLSKKVQVLGLELCAPIPDPVLLADQRQTDCSQMWVAGCSISHGVGVASDQRYGALLAKELAMSCSFLTRPGSAIDWAADQILRSDIRKGDLVVWGITSLHRITYIHQHKLLNGINIQSYRAFPDYAQIVSPNTLTSHQTYYHHLYAIKQVQNFCRIAGANLVLVGLMPNNHALLKFLKSQHNYIDIPYKSTFQNNTFISEFLDTGTDDKHPGVQQHQSYKNCILDHIQNRLSA